MKLKTSFCTIAYRNSKKDLKVILKEIKEMGFDGAELWGNHLEDLSDEELVEIKEYASSINLELPIASFYLGLFNLPMDNLEEMIELTKKACSIANKIGAKKLRSFAGWTCECSSLTASKEYWDFNIKGFKAMKPIIEKAKLDLVFETHTKTMVDTVMGIEKLLGAVGSKNYKLNFQIEDICELSKMATPLDVYRKLNSDGFSIAHMHMHNEIREDEVKEYKELFTEMIKDEFDGFISMEHCSGEGDPVEVGKKGLALQQELFSI